MRFSGSLATIVAAATIAAAYPAYAAPMSMVRALGKTERVSFDVVLPLRDPAGLAALVAAQNDTASPQFHHWLTPAEVEDRFGPDQASIARATAALEARGLTVSRTGRLLQASGTADAVNATLRTTVAIGRTPSGYQHAYATKLATLPSEIASLGGMLIGLSANPHVAHTFSRRVAVSPAVLAAPQSRRGATGGYWYDDLKQAYQYPSYQTMITKNGQTTRLDGTGTTIGIVMSSDVYDSDINAVFNHENFMANSGQKSNPKLFKRVPVDGGATTSSSALDEASLDVQEALTGAPGAHVILYDMPTLSDSNIVDAYFKVVTDNQADVVSSSFGACELYYTAAYNGGVDETGVLKLQHQLFLQGNAQGITFLASAGDNAGLECTPVSYITAGANGQFVAGVSTPAADPNVTAVGGTNVVTQTSTTSLDSTYVGENAYGDPLIPYDPNGTGGLLSGGYWGAGGGLSTVNAKPSYQSIGNINTGSNSARALPDIGMQVGGCPGSISQQPCNGGNSPLNGNGNTQRSFVIVSIGGAFEGLIGTSVSSPEFSSVVALLVEQYGRMGNLNPYIYQMSAAQTASNTNNPARSTTAFHRSIPGYNGVVTNNQPVNALGRAYNYTVGVGTPVVYRFIGASSAAPAGVPQSSTNP
ncbi:protease pro-enzyme activation domain-containing protein [Acetobacteraceae bacterium KSS8]|uniref:Protease pro-enzyme activation domain-containing protein n=1 Tax=Endosaccharibacter trunci TaxID=2812733 RepID=A0ABT1W981_9PROT|nr:protease pro-enzyme activation domain-containing protein [Acetobacteraceae bacterium KSS8]